LPLSYWYSSCQARGSQRQMIFPAFMHRRNPNCSVLTSLPF
jgi:hypothetical protein